MVTVDPEDVGSMIGASFGPVETQDVNTNRGRLRIGDGGYGVIAEIGAEVPTSYQPVPSTGVSLTVVSTCNQNC